MGAKFPLLSKIVSSDLYRTLVAVCLILAMIWSLNDPRRGGWLVMAALTTWAAVRLLRREKLRGHPLLLLGLVYGAYLMIPKTNETSIPMHYFATAAFWMVLVYAWIIFDTCDGYVKKTDWENALILVAVIAVGQTLYEAASWYRDYLHWQKTLAFAAPGIAYRASGSFTAHPNNLAALLNAIWPLVLLRLLHARRLYLRFFWGFILGLFLLAMLLANSRGGILGTAAIIGFLLVIAFVSRYPGLIARPANIWGSIPRRDKFLGGALLLAGLVLVGAIFWRAAFTGTQSSILLSRNFIWVYSWQAFTHSPWIGNGAGSFVLQYAQAAKLPPGFVAPHAHNLELQALVISGVVGLFFLLAALVVLIYTFIATLRKLAGQDRMHFVLLGAFLVGVLAHNQFDYVLEGSPTNLITYLVLLAVWLSFSRPDQKSWPWRVWLPVTVLAAISLILPVMQLARLFDGQERYEASMALSRQAEWDQAYPIVCDLADAHTRNQFYTFQCSLLKSMAGYTHEDMGMLAEALQEAGAAIAANPWWPVNRANYAGLLWNAGQYAEALQEMRTAAEGVNRNATISLNFALMADQLDEFETATAAYRLAMLNDPYQVGEPRYAATPAGSTAQAQITRLVLEANTWDDFRAAAPEAPFTTQREWTLWRGTTASQLGNFELAREILFGQLSENPDGLSENSHYAYFLSKSGAKEEAQKYAEILYFAAERQLISVGITNTGWFPFYVAGHVFRQNGRLTEAKEALTATFQIINQVSSSSGYDLNVYRNFAPVWDINPTLDWGLLTKDKAADFHWLSDELSRSGETELADQVQRWLELQERPKLEIR